MEKPKSQSFSVRHERLLLVLFFVFLTYSLVGVFPVVPTEGDGIAIANGSTLAAIEGLGPNILTYRYSAQSGAYVLITALHALTGLDTFILFSLVSGLASIFSVVFSALLLKELTACSFAVAGIVLLLFQESFTAGYYPNSTVIAAPLAILAIYLLTINKGTYLKFVASALFGIAAWIRFDVILLAPALIFLLHKNSLQQTLRQAVVVGAVAGACCIMALQLSGANITEILSSVVAHKSAADTEFQLDRRLISRDLKMHTVFFSALLVFLLVYGGGFLLAEKRWKLLGLCLVTIAPFYIVFWGSFTTPKYLYYLIPFFSIPIIFAILHIENRSRSAQLYLVSILGVLFLVQYGIAMQYTSTRKKSPASPLFAINNPVNTDRRLEISVCSRKSIPTHDGPRFRSGILCAPVEWNRAKRARKREIEKFYSYIQNIDADEITVLAVGWRYSQLAIHSMHRSGYFCHQNNNNTDGNNADIKSITKYVCEKGNYARFVVAVPDAEKAILVSEDTRTKAMLVDKILKAVGVRFITLCLDRGCSDFLNNYTTNYTRVSDLAYDATIARE